MGWPAKRARLSMVSLQQGSYRLMCRGVPAANERMWRQLESHFSCRLQDGWSTAAGAAPFDVCRSEQDFPSSWRNGQGQLDGTLAEGEGHPHLLSSQSEQNAPGFERHAFIWQLPRQAGPEAQQRRVP